MATSGPTTTVLNGIEVKFPFEPYKLQKAFMSQVIRSLKLKKNALLESPTGTGKTLSILCAALSWLNFFKKTKAAESAKADTIKNENKKAAAKENTEENTEESDKESDKKSEENNKTRIYFSSRTHSQLSQSIKELKKTNYNNNSAIVLAGRDLLCLNEEVTQLDNISAKNQACKLKTGKIRSCPYYIDFEQRVRDKKELENQVIDIEDLIEFGKKHSVCPYFTSKYLQAKSEVTFLPYNYLLDSKIRRAQKISLKDRVVIFDEGHNIEKMCEDSVSADLISDHLATCIREMPGIIFWHSQALADQIMDTQVTDAAKELAVDNLPLLKMTLDDLEKAVNTRVQQLLASRLTEEGGVCEPDYIFNVLTKLNLTFEKIHALSNICDKVQAFLFSLLPVKGPIAVAASSSLNSFKDFLNALAPDPEEDANLFVAEFKNKFRVYIEVIEPENARFKTFAKPTTQHFNRARPVAKAKPQPDPNEDARKWVLHLWCLSPSVGLKGLVKSETRSIILTSGTLAPLDSFEAEFENKFECRIQNNHIIAASQMAILPVSHSSKGTRLDSSYTNKDNINYYRALGDTVLDICKEVPDGVLLFFSSYSVMNNSMNKWKVNDATWKIWTELSRLKTVFIESKNRDEFNDDLARYKDTVKRGKGCIFFSICRGKLSEGIDLSDAQSRGVILIGMPYPPWKDPRVTEKRAYLDRVKHPNFTGYVWYKLQMKRALNQAVGRAIRNKNDYGCVFLLDYRFENQVQDLSKWCVPFVKRPATYRDMMIETKKFFDSKKTNISVQGQTAIAFTAASSNQQAGDDRLNKNQSNKRPFYGGDRDDKKQKRAKQIASQGNVLKPIQPATDIASVQNVQYGTVKKKRKHVPIQY